MRIWVGLGCLAACAAVTSTASGQSLDASGLIVREQQQTALGGAFAVAGPANAPLSLGASRYDADRGLIDWSSRETVTHSKSGKRVDSVRVSTATYAPQTGGLVLPRPGVDAEDFASVDAYDVTLTRGWPAALAFSAGKLDIDVSPHAAIGFGDSGNSAEAGAMLRVGKDLEDRVDNALGSVGLRDGSSFGDKGRWYLFAAASGRAVGMNMLQGAGGWERAGWSTDATSRLVGDAQAGVAWRKGAMQASVGYVSRKIKGKEQFRGMDTIETSMVALSFSLRPKW
ncbi:lipid A-modifier LpxR family protein [Caulobacter sp. NIBR2454]|uniref:lipid A-modifier LpxR family protein n=1 Tax=Caulobacter sp. NIBR2454 TaxID=3015996 RepID=UPI0022B6E81C|nr:lipid A-modifier LpxR family protein [Caulobacter sp. NIBR2454]